MNRTVIVSGARTPIGRLSGTLSEKAATELGAIAIGGALGRAAIGTSDIDYVVFGHVLQAGLGHTTARQAAVAAGIPLTVPATSINKVCLSSLNALHLADLMVSAGDADIVVAGGMESMSRAPHLLSRARSGYRYGSGELVDVIVADGLSDAFDHRAMGELTDHDALEAGISRDRQDEIAVESHRRSARASEMGWSAEEIVPVTTSGRSGEAVVEQDEGIRPGTTTEALAKLRPAFVEGGTVTAGNSSQISDGAAALVVTHMTEVERRGTAPLAEILSYGQVAGPDTSLLTQPSRAIKAALDRGGLQVSDIDLFEINEAFAAVVAASMADLSVPEDVVNVNGGAISLGHPIGMSGARIVLALAFELRRRGGGIGVAALCGGGGQGDAVVIRVPDQRTE